VTQLRQKMLEELQRRNYSHRTAKPTFASSAILRSIFTSHLTSSGPSSARAFGAGGLSVIIYRNSAEP
jgi:hypothetical protein